MVFRLGFFLLEIGVICIYIYVFVIYDLFIFGVFVQSEGGCSISDVLSCLIIWDGLFMFFKLLL